MSVVLKLRVNRRIFEETFSPGVKTEREVVRGVPAGYQLFQITPVGGVGMVDEYDLWFAQPEKGMARVVEEVVCETHIKAQDDSLHIDL